MTLGRWRKSSYSNSSQGACVEISLDLDLAGIRDSKNADGPHLTVPQATWSAFLTDIKH
jgi:hypothetical protein